MKNKIVIKPNKGIYINDIPIFLKENKDDLFSLIPEAEIKPLGRNNEWSIIYKSVSLTVAFNRDLHCNYISYIPSDRNDVIFLEEKLITSNVLEILKTLNFYEGSLVVNEYNEKYIVHFGLNIMFYVSIIDVLEDEEGNENIIYNEQWDAIYLISDDNRKILESAATLGN